MTIPKAVQTTGEASIIYIGNTTWSNDSRRSTRTIIVTILYLKYEIAATAIGQITASIMQF